MTQRQGLSADILRFLHDLRHAGGTGGLNWHVHAFYERARWTSTIAQLESFFAHVQPASNHLLLIGGSAGWMMPTSWLMRFERIDAYDIDPLASHLMSWRVGKSLRRHGVAVHHHRQDALATLDVLLDQHPKACLWFDNLLGQHRYRVRDEARAEQELTALKTQLVGRHWGSIHDLLSGPTGDNTWTGRIATLTRDGLDVTRMDSPHTQALLRDVAAQNVWIDHLTSQVFPDHTATRLIPWAFKDRYCHWLQAGWVAAS